MTIMPKTLTFGMSDSADAVDYALGRTVYTPAEIDAMDEDAMDRLNEILVRTETGEVRDLNEVEVIYGAGWKITGFRI